MILKSWLDGFLSRSFHGIPLRKRRFVGGQRRRSARVGWSSEALEVRRLLTANLEDLHSDSVREFSLSTSSVDVQAGKGHNEDDPPNESDPAVAPTDVTGAFLSSAGGNDLQALAYNDIFQGKTDDCVLMSALSALSRVQGNSLSSNVTLLSHSGDTFTYQVKFWHLTGGSYQPVYESVTWDGTRVSGDPHYGDNHEYWPIIYQRAFLKYASDLGLDYHVPDVVFSALTGSATVTSAVTSSLSAAQGLKSKLDAGIAEIAGTKDTSTMFINSTWGIISDHEYTVIGLEIPTNGDLSKTYVTLRNPWGRDTAWDWYDTDGSGEIDGDEYVKAQSGMDGANDGLIRIPWSVFSSSFEFSSSSGHGGSSINVPLPQPVKFDHGNYGPYTIYEGQPLTVNLHATDPAGNYVLYWTDIDQPGNVHPQTGQFTWTPMNGDYGDQYFEVHADAGPYTSATVGFVVHVLPGSPTITSTSASPSPIHDDGSDLITLKATVTVPYGQISSVEFYNDSNNDGNFEPGTDALLVGDGVGSGNNYIWQGYAGGLVVGQHHFFVVATRSDHDVFKGYADLVATVVTSPHVDPVAIPVGNESLFTTAGNDETVIRARSDGAGHLYALVADQTPNSSTHVVKVAKFDSAGNFLTGFQVAENTTGALADFVVLPDGSVGVAWQEYNTPNYGTSNILVRWYSSTGTPTTTAKTVVTGSAWAQNPSFNVASDSAGNMLIVYNKGDFLAEDVWALSVARDGTVIRNPWMVNSHATNSQRDASVALNANGEGVIVWQDLDQGILMARQVSSSGVNNGPEFNITTTFAAYSGLDTAVGSNGEFYISWVGTGIILQKFSSAGVRAGGEVHVNTFGGGTSSYPTLALSTSGWMTVAWDNSVEDGNAGVYAQVLDPTLTKVGPEFALPDSSSLARLQANPRLLMDADGDIAAFFDEQDGGNTYHPRGVYKRMFNVDLPPVFDTAGPLSIPENSVAGTVVGSVHATDSDPGSSVSYSLQDSSLFTIDSASGQIKVASGAVLDYESHPSYAIPVKATSGAKSTIQNVQINLTNVNEAPTLTLTDGAPQFTANNSPVLVADPFDLEDLDTPVFTGGNLIAAITANGTSQDQLSFTDVLGITVDSSNNVLWYTTVIGTLASSGVGLTPLQVNLNSDATLPIVRTLLRSVQFGIVGTPTSLLSRTISFTVNDGQLTSAPASRVVAVANNSAPILNNAGSPVLDSIAEDVVAGSNPGTLISSLIASMGPAGGISDADPGARQGVAITVADQTHGTWQFTTNGSTWKNFGALSITSALLLASDANTKVRFLPNADYNGIATFTYVAWDQTAGSNGTAASAASRGATKAFSIGYDTAVLTVTPTNDAPVLNNAGTPTLASITEDQTLAGNPGTLISAVISSMGPLGGITDVDLNAPRGIAITVADQTHGTWQFTTNGTTWTNFGTLSVTNALQLAADAKTRVRFVPNLDYNGISTFTYVAWDQSAGTNGGYASATARGLTRPFSNGYDTAVITVTPMNDAPVLNNAGSSVLTSIAEDVAAASNPGTLISSLIASMSPLGSISDVDLSAKRGIAITVADQTHGTWQFTTDGTTWTNFGTLSITNALQLASDANTKVRFLPNADYTGIATFTYVAWDQTGGLNGTTASASSRGFTTPFSLGYDTAILTVSGVNDAPVLNATGSPVLPTITEDLSLANNSGTLISSLIASMSPLGSISDVDLAAQRGIAISVADQTHGVWQFTTDGVTWNPVGALSASAALQLAADAKTRIRFVANANFSGISTFTFVAWDQTTGTNGTTASVTTRGGTKAFSTGYDTAVVTVTPVNDAPVLAAAGNPVLASITKNILDASNKGTLVSTIIASMGPQGSITDADTGAKQGIAIIGANQVSGTWQFSTDGTTWTSFGAIAATNTLLLASDAKTKIRFIPNANFTGTVGFTFAAWDQTSGVNGSFISLTSSGGATAFSSVRDNAFISVT